MEGEVLAIAPGKSEIAQHSGKLRDSDVEAEPQKQEKTPELQKFLRFKLGDADIGLLPVEGIWQAVQIELADILPVPQMPSCVMGVYNWRGDMLWLVDFQDLVGLKSLLSSESSRSNAIACMAIVIEINNRIMGLVVERVEDIEERDRLQMQPIAAGLFSADLQQFLQGYFVNVARPGKDSGSDVALASRQKSENQMLMVFSGEAIVEAPVWRVV